MFRHLIAAALALLTPHASASLLDTAGSVSVRMNGYSQGYAVGNVTIDNFGNIGIGQFRGTLNDASFLTYCTDLFQGFSWNKTYTYAYAGTDSAQGLTSTQASRLGKLYTAVGDVENTNESVAFQLAVWELMYEATPANVTNGAFKLLAGISQTQRDLANTWLAGVMAQDAVQAFHAQRLTSSVAQDFVVFTAIPQPLKLISSVPEPAGYALVGVALAGLAATGRRRRR